MDIEETEGVMKPWPESDGDCCTQSIADLSPLKGTGNSTGSEQRAKRSRWENASAIRLYLADFCLFRKGAFFAIQLICCLMVIFLSTEYTLLSLKLFNQWRLFLLLLKSSTWMSYLYFLLVQRNGLKVLWSILQDHNCKKRECKCAAFPTTCLSSIASIAQYPILRVNRSLITNCKYTADLLWVERLAVISNVKWEKPMKQKVDKIAPWEEDNLMIIYWRMKWTSSSTTRLAKEEQCIFAVWQPRVRQYCLCGHTSLRKCLIRASGETTETASVGRDSRTACSSCRRQIRWRVGREQSAFGGCSTGQC